MWSWHGAVDLSLRGAQWVMRAEPCCFRHTVSTACRPHQQALWQQIQKLAGANRTKLADVLPLYLAEDAVERHWYLLDEQVPELPLRYRWQNHNSGMKLSRRRDRKRELKSGPQEAMLIWKDLPQPQSYRGY